jgi:hypothetical protein
MTDVKVEQCDIDMAFGYLRLGEAHWIPEPEKHARARPLALAFARHRQAAEKATREQCAKVAEACPFVPWRYQSKEWGEAFETGRSFAAEQIATAIRSQNDG